MIGSSISETNFLHKLLLIDRLIVTLFNGFANLSANIKLSKNINIYTSTTRWISW